MAKQRGTTFSYQPAQAVRCLAEGDYIGRFAEVSEARTTHGLPMLKLVWEVVSGGDSRVVYGWIVSPTSIYLLRELATAFGAEEAFDSGELDIRDYLHREASLKLGVIRDPFYGEHNVIHAYACRTPGNPDRGGSVENASVQGQPAARKRGIDSRSADPEINEEDIPF